jgi:hypothetical protein
MMFPEHQSDIAISSSSKLPGWRSAGRVERRVFHGKGHVVRPDAITHREFKLKKGKKGNKHPPTVPVYPNPLLSPWQKDMAQAIHDGHNIIADVPTSCGKTWTANLTVAYEVLARDDVTGAKGTALIISPNSEVMRDSVKDICERHQKHYNYASKMLDTMTRNFVTYDEHRSPTSQIMVIAVECVEEFITDPINALFVENMRFIIFDEVHLGPVTRALWWSQYIPHTAQLILLSATLGNSEEVNGIVTHIQSLQEGRPRDTTVITYKVRPIPLQPLLFKGCPLPDDGVISKTLKGAGALSCVVNQFDPTVRDIMSLAGRDTPIPETRENQYFLGQEVIKAHPELIQQKLDTALQTAVVEPTVENIYTLLCYLFSNDKAPVMVFNTTADATETLARAVIGHISHVENLDPEFRVAQKQLEIFEKEHYRSRDKKPRLKSDEKACGDWGKALPGDPSEETINIHAVRKTLGKWRFPLDVNMTESAGKLKTPEGRPIHMPQWIKDCLEYGIGIYVSTMKPHVKHFMFDAFRQGKIHVLFSDSSISVGINLPIRTAVLCGNVSGSISHTLYKQASGRAGRRGLDNQGFIVHMMPKKDIRACLTTASPEVHLNRPEKMTYSDLIRLLVPSNLDGYYSGDELSAKAADRIPEYKRRIIESYLSALSQENREQCLKQIALIHKEKWHYHRLTNMIKTLPEAASIIVIKLLVSGVLHTFEVKDFIDLMGILFFRVEADEDLDSDAAKDYYVPEFKEFPDFIARLQKISDVYNLQFDFSRPVHRYFSDFCRKHIIHMDYLTHLDEMGEWLYTFKRSVQDVAPYSTKWQDKKKRRERVYSDKFAKMLIMVDHDYLAARAYRSI